MVLQWLDENSLRAVEQLVSDAAAVPVMLILIVRASPGAAPPPVISGLRRIDLGPMPVSGIEAILARTFDHRMSSAEDLATQLHTLSGGNPLHVTQILHLMASRGGIYWDVDAEMWKWSGSAGSDHAMNDDVLTLIAERIAGLDPELRQALRTAAGLAEVFDTGELAVVLDRVWAEVNASLSALAASGLILSAESDGEMVRWRFIHDHVRLAAIRDVPQSERTALRYRIGLKLLSQRDDASLHKHDFIITDCLADFPEETLDPATRRRLAQREILVGVDARRRLDFAEAARHLDRAAKLLPAEPWRNARSECVQITEEQIYCAFACGDAEATGRLFREALDHSPDPLDAVYFYRLQVVIETQAENYAGALLAAAKGLSKFGVRMPLGRSSAVAVAAFEFLRVSFRLGRDPIAKLKTLPASGDPMKRAAIDLIAAVITAAYWAAPELMVAGGLKILSLSLSGGRARSTPLGEVLYALGVSAFLGARRAGFRFGEFAVQSAAMDGDACIENQVLLIHAAFVRLWATSLIDDEPLLRRGYELARKCGDMLFANFHILGLMSHGLARGAPLGELEDLIRWGEDLIRRSRESFSLATIEKWRDVVVALRGPAPLRAEVPVALRPGAGAQRGNQTSECYRRAMLCQFLYFAGDIAGSAAAGRAADRIMWRSPGHLIKIEHAFYYGLALAAAARQTSGASWRAEFALRRMIRRLARWAAGGSDTFSARLSLLRAEHASLKRSSLAVPLYEEAIRAAHASQMLHVAALANEAAARHFIRLGSQTAAQGYAVQARDLFESWGAVGKVRALEAEMPELLRRPDEMEAVSFARGAADFAGGALLSASDPDELLAILLTIAGRISGADLAVYASVESRSVTINAEAHGINEPAQAGLPPEMLDSASPSVLRYAAATGEGLWGNLAADRRFKNCSRLAARRPKAVCCLPVQRSGKILGLLYLEHFANPAAFSFSVVEALKNLTGNLASALENEETNRALRARNAELTEAARKIALLESAKTQFEKFAPGIVRTEILANPKAPNLDAQPCDVTVLFLDIAGYTNMNERLSPEEARALVERCFSRLLDPIYRHGGEVCEWSGDGLMIFFSSGDPCEHAIEAVRSALEMKQECRAMMAETPPGEPRVVVNFGLNSGLGVVGLTRLEALATAAGSIL